MHSKDLQGISGTSYRGLIITTSSILARFLIMIIVYIYIYAPKKTKNLF